jgi:hypothetical protein
MKRKSSDSVPRLLKYLTSFTDRTGKFDEV